MMQYTNNSYDDKLQLAKALDRLEACERKYQKTFTDFLDPSRADKFMNILNRENRDKQGILIRTFGGYAEAERKMIGFIPEGHVSLASSDDDFPISTLIITYNMRFAKPPSHRDYLGSVLGLGIDRCKVGDIRLAEGGAVLYVSNDIAAYVAGSLENVGNTDVKVKIGNELPTLHSDANLVRINVASLRLDAVISGAFKLSRGKSASLVDGEKVFVNWTMTSNGSKTLKDGDIVTVRGLGRIKIEAEVGKTKKDRFVLAIMKY